MGRSDAVEYDEIGMYPVEYKAGVPHGFAANAQLCAQALCLEEMFGIEVSHGYVWYSAIRRKVFVKIDEPLRQRTIRNIYSIQRMIHDGQTPVVYEDERCEECQLRPRCLPGVITDVGRALDVYCEIVGGSSA